MLVFAQRHTHANLSLRRRTSSSWQTACASKASSGGSREAARLIESARSSRRKKSRVQLRSFPFIVLRARVRARTQIETNRCVFAIAAMSSTRRPMIAATGALQRLSSLYAKVNQEFCRTIRFVSSHTQCAHCRAHTHCAQAVCVRRPYKQCACASARCARTQTRMRASERASAFHTLRSLGFWPPTHARTHGSPSTTRSQFQDSDGANRHRVLQPTQERRHVNANEKRRNCEARAHH